MQYRLAHFQGVREIDVSRYVEDYGFVVPPSGNLHDVLSFTGLTSRSEFAGALRRIQVRVTENAQVKCRSPHATTQPLKHFTVHGFTLFSDLSAHNLCYFDFLLRRSSTYLTYTSLATK